MNLTPVETTARDGTLTMAVGWALVWFLAHGSLIGLTVAALLRGLRRRSADLRYLIACTGLLAMAICPVFTTLQLLAAERSRADAGVRRPRFDEVSERLHDVVGAVTIPGIGEIAATPAPAAGPISGGDVVPVVSTPVAAQPESSRWWEPIEACLPAVVAFWLTGVGAMALRLAKGLVDVQGLTRRGTLDPTDEHQVLIDRLMKRSGLRRPVPWLLSLRVEVPTVVGWLWPTVLIPAQNLKTLTVRQLEALLAHEIAHIRRHDYLMNLGQIAVESVLFFHPAVWWMSRRIRAERENCCDDAAAALCGGDRLLVARALFALEENRRVPAFRVTAAGASLKERVQRLVSPVPAASGPTEAGWVGGGLIAGLLGILATGWLTESTQARDKPTPGAAPATIQGRVFDEAAGAGDPRPVDLGEVVTFNEQAKLRFQTHGARFWASTISPDGKVAAVVAGTEEGTRSGPCELRLYDVSEPRLVARVKERVGIHSVAFAPDGRMVATGGYDRTVKVRDAATGALLATLGDKKDVEFRDARLGIALSPRGGFGNLVTAVAFAPDGKTLAAGSLDESVQLWDTTTWKGARTIPIHGQPVLSLAFAPDGEMLAVGTGEPGGGVGTLTLLKAVTLKAHQRLDKLEEAVRAVAFAPDGNRLAVAFLGSEAGAGGISVWDPVTGQRLQAYAPGLVADAVAFAPDGKTLTAGLRDGRIVLLDAESPLRRATLAGHSAPVLSLAYSDDGLTILSAGRDGTLRRWGPPATPLALAHTLTAHESKVWFATFSPDGKTLATGGGDSTVRLWDAAALTPLATLRGHSFSVGLGLFTADGKSLITSAYDRTIKVWDLPAGTERLNLTGHSRSVTFIALTPDGKRLASASEDHTVMLWDLAAGERLRVFPEQPALINGVAFSPDGKTLAAAVGDRRTDEPGFVKLWDVDTGQERAGLAGFHLAASKVAFSPDGRLLAASSQDGTIKLWNSTTCEELTTLSREAGVRTIAFSPDGRTLASGHDKGSMTLWDVETGSNRLTQKVHDRDVLGISFAPGGRTLATAGLDGKARLWHASKPRNDPLP